MRQQTAVRRVAERGGGGQGLLAEDVEHRAREAAGAEGGGERVLVEEVPAPEVAEEGGRLQQRQAACVEEAVGLRPGGEEAEDVVGERQERIELLRGRDAVLRTEPVRRRMRAARDAASA